MWVQTPEKGVGVKGRARLRASHRQDGHCSLNVVTYSWVTLGKTLTSEFAHLEVGLMSPTPGCCEDSVMCFLLRDPAQGRSSDVGFSISPHSHPVVERVLTISFHF